MCYSRLHGTVWNLIFSQDDTAKAHLVQLGYDIPAFLNRQHGREYVARGYDHCESLFIVHRNPCYSG